MQRYQEMLDDLRALGSYEATVKARDVPIGALWVGKGFVRGRKTTQMVTAPDFDYANVDTAKIAFKDEEQRIGWETLPGSQEIEVEVPIQDG